MHTSTRWTRFEEPLRRTLARNATLAAIVGAVFALVRQDLSVLLSVTPLALWPSLGGHFIELAFLNGLRPRIPQGRMVQVAVRLLVWSGGGVLLYACVAASARALSVQGPPMRLWWYGGFLFIGLELAVHAVLAIRGLPNFYDGRG